MNLALMKDVAGAASGTGIGAARGRLGLAVVAAACFVATSLGACATPVATLVPDEVRSRSPQEQAVTLRTQWESWRGKPVRGADKQAMARTRWWLERLEGEDADSELGPLLVAAIEGQLELLRTYALRYPDKDDVPRDEAGGTP